MSELRLDPNQPDGTAPIHKYVLKAACRQVITKWFDEYKDTLVPDRSASPAPAYAEGCRARGRFTVEMMKFLQWFDKQEM